MTDETTLPAAPDTPPVPPELQPPAAEAPVDPQPPAPDPAPTAGDPAAPSAPAEQAPVEAAPVQPPVDQQGVCVDGVVYRGRDDNDVLTGFFCRVIDGELQGRYGVLTGTAEAGPDGWPVQATIRTRDDRDEYLTVPYASLRPAQAGGR